MSYYKKTSSGLSIVDKIKNCCVNKQNQRLFEIFVGGCEVCIKGERSGEKDAGVHI